MARRDAAAGRVPVINTSGGTMAAGTPGAKIIPLHDNPGRAAPDRQVRQRHDGGQRPPSFLVGPNAQVSAEQLEPTVWEIDQRRAGTRENASGLAGAVAAVSQFMRRRLTGDYTVDESGYDPHFTDGLVMPLLRMLGSSWFRVEANGIGNLPEKGAALVVANHSTVLPFDAMMCSMVVHHNHPAHRSMRLLAADIVFNTAMLSQIARKAGAAIACTTDAHRLLANGELTAVFPGGFNGWAKHFRDRYKL